MNNVDGGILQDIELAMDKGIRERNEPTKYPKPKFDQESIRRWNTIANEANKKVLDKYKTHLPDRSNSTDSGLAL